MHLYAVQWSDYQQCYHIEPLNEAIQTNVIQFLKSRPIQYSIVGIFKTYDQALSYQQELEDARTEQINFDISN